MNVDLRKLEQVFSAAKASFRHGSDMAVYHASEHWCSPSEMRDQMSRVGAVLGDCDDFASLCVMLCRKTGVPARFVLCLTEHGESHLVAEVDGWIFDNREAHVVARDDLDYTWLAISGFNPGDPWHAIAKDKQ